MRQYTAGSAHCSRSCAAGRRRNRRADLASAMARTRAKAAREPRKTSAGAPSARRFHELSLEINALAEMARSEQISNLEAIMTLIGDISLYRIRVE